MKAHIATIPSFPFAENTFIAHGDGRSDCIVVDPGLEPQRIIDYLKASRLTPAALMITHGHGDHIGGNTMLKKQWPDCPIVIGYGDAAKLTDAQLNMSAAFGGAVLSPPADIVMREGETYSAAGFDLEVLEIPGHSSGHVVYVWRGQKPFLVFGGDVLFAGSIGRTDFPGGSFSVLAQGIRSKLFVLPDDTLVLPGHGPQTTIGQERSSNPFVGDDADPAALGLL